MEITADMFFFSREKAGDFALKCGGDASVIIKDSDSDAQLLDFQGNID